MTQTLSGASRAFAVPWKDLERWVIPSSVFLRRALPPGWTRCPISDLVVPVTERVRVEADAEYKMAGVKWYGEGVFHRETVRGDGMSAAYVTRLVPDALIYNRLFAWKASFAVVPTELGDCYVSNEFPQFVVNKSRLLPEYLYLFCICSTTIRAVNAASTGSAAVSRNRFKEDQFLDFDIPVPPLTEQHAIVEKWRRAKDDIAGWDRAVDEAKSAIDRRFFEDLGLDRPEALVKRRALAVSWADLLRWGVDFNLLNQSGADLTQGEYPVVKLGSILDHVQYGTSEKANSTNNGVAVIRMNNVVDGELKLADLKHVPLPKAELERLILVEGDILFNRTNSKELVGKCAVFHERGAFVFASYLIRVRANPSKANPDFVAYVINSPIGRQQINALSRQIIGQANVNSEELRSLRIPLPPLALQKEIMSRVAQGKERISELRAAAAKMRSQIVTDIEALILGSKQVKDN